MGNSSSSAVNKSTEGDSPRDTIGKTDEISSNKP